MQKLITICLLAVASVLGISAQEKCQSTCCTGKSIYDIKVVDDAGKDVSISEYKRKLLLIVNTATRCGFTPQYKELEALYEKYRSQGFEILDFPCNQFGEQAPGTIQEIHQFCTANFNVQFPQFDKIEVNGENEHPLYTWLKGGNDIKWNFTKFLVSRDGKILRRYEPRDKISDIEVDIVRELNPVLSSIMTRTSIRQYTDQPVSKTDIETLLRAGMAAPTAVNKQPWHFVAVTDKAKLKELAGNRGRMLEQCALAIVVCGNMEKALTGKGQEYWIQDCSAATENILLAAHALGLGAVWTGVYPMDDRVAAVSKAVKLPETIVPLCVIVIGHPAESPTPKDKWKPENVSYNEFGGKTE
jgi:glutathione peroxidase-family protein